MNSPTAALRSFLADQLDTVTVSTTMVGWAEGNQWVRITKTGGDTSDPTAYIGYIRRPRFNVDVYGPDYDSTEALSELVYEALMLLNRASWGVLGVTITSADPYGEPQYVPDPVSGTVAHFNFLVELCCRPSTGGDFGGGGNIEDTSSSFHYEVTQSSPSTFWVIHHNLGMDPNVTVLNSDGEEVGAEVNYVDSNTVTVTWLEPMTGKVICS